MMIQRIQQTPVSSELRRLHELRVALPGLGGVGGGHAQVLAEMGVGVFHLADFDSFELANFNRQIGATMSSLGRPKAEVTRELVLNANPAAQVTLFGEGIHSENIDAFLRDVDVVVDGIEFFAIDIRRLLYKACRVHRIPVIHAGPIGYGATVLVFTPDGPSFDEYFRINEDMTRAEMLAAHALGHGTGLRSELDMSRVDFFAHTGPALAPACMLCSALASQEVLHMIRGEPFNAAAPDGIHVDFFHGRMVPLKPRPSLTRSLRGRLLKRLIFRKLPGLRELHETELVARGDSVA